MLGFAATAMAAGALRGVIDDAGFLWALATLATGGAAMFGSAAFRLPGWARLRRRQMEDVAARAASITSPPPSTRVTRNDSL